jgi:hypothetical protein
MANHRLEHYGAKPRRSSCAPLCGSWSKEREYVSLRQAPKFCAYFQHLEGRQVMRMPRTEWVRIGQIQTGDMVEVNLSITPMAGVAVDNRIEAVVAERHSDGEVVVDVYRYDPKDMPTPINVDRYRVWECLPPHRDYFSMVNSASTEDNSNMRGFLDDHVFLVKAEVDRNEHHLRELPPRVRDVLARGTGGAA